MADHSGSILVVRKGFVPPKDLVEKLLVGTTVAGVAWAVQGKLSVHRWPDKKGHTPDLGQVMEGLEKFKDLTAIFYFGKYPLPFLPDDVQPFEILSDGKQPRLVACLDGEFKDQTNTSSQHSNQFFAVQANIRPNIDMLAGVVGEDTAKLMALIKTPIQTKNFLDKGERGVVCFLSNTGEFVTMEMANGGVGLEADWGYCSNVHDYGKTYPPEIEEEEEEEVVDLPWKTTDTKAEEEIPSPPPAPKEEKQVIAAADVSKERLTALMAMFELNGKDSTIRPSRELKTLNDLRRWYRRNFGGWCPQSVDGRPWVETTRLDRDSPVFKELLNKGADKIGVRFPPIKSLTELPKDVLAAPTSPAPPKHTKAEQKTGEKRETPDQPIKIKEDDVPIISGAAKANIQKTILTKEFRDRTMQNIRDPKRIQEDEKRFGTFTSQIGLKGLEETFGWVFEDWCDLAAVDLKAVCVALTQYQNSLISVLAEKEGVEEEELIGAFGGKKSVA